MDSNKLISILQDPGLFTQNKIQSPIFLKGRELCMPFWDNFHQTAGINFSGALYWVVNAMILTKKREKMDKVILGGTNNVCVLSRFGHVTKVFVTLRTVTHQAPLSMGFSSKNTGVGSHALLQGIFLTQELKLSLYVSCIGWWVLIIVVSKTKMSMRVKNSCSLLPA